MTPFLKWVGGKGKLLPQLYPLLPADVDQRRHVEPFVGGGALFFGREPKGPVLLADMNFQLINAYYEVRDTPEDLIEYLKVLALDHSEELYYTRRKAYNMLCASGVGYAPLFIYLNKTCFNGLHRTNKKGDFNVPVGSYKNPLICDEDTIRKASKCLQGVVLRTCDFRDIPYLPGDFVYFDPPYMPVSATSNFTAYVGSFGEKEHVALRDLMVQLSKQDIKCMLSNSDTPWLRELYKDMNVTTVQAGRSINSDGAKRGAVTELVVRTY